MFYNFDIIPVSSLNPAWMFRSVNFGYGGPESESEGMGGASEAESGPGIGGVGGGGGGYGGFEGGYSGGSIPGFGSSKGYGLGYGGSVDLGTTGGYSVSGYGSGISSGISEEGFGLGFGDVGIGTGSGFGMDQAVELGKAALSALGFASVPNPLSAAVAARNMISAYGSIQNAQKAMTTYGSAPGTEYGGISLNSAVTGREPGLEGAGEAEIMSYLEQQGGSMAQPGQAGSPAGTQASYEQQALDYLKERDVLPRKFSEGALSKLAGAYGLEGGVGSQQQLIEQAKASPIYQAMQREGEEAIRRNASATGGLRSGNVQANLAKYNQGLISDVYQQQLQGLSGLAGTPGYGAQIPGAMTAIGSTLAGGQLADERRREAEKAQNIQYGIAAYKELGGLEGITSGISKGYDWLTGSPSI